MPISTAAYSLIFTSSFHLLSAMFMCIHAGIRLYKNEISIYVGIPLALLSWPIHIALFLPIVQTFIAKNLQLIHNGHGIRVQIVEMTISNIVEQCFTKDQLGFQWVWVGYMSMFLLFRSFYGPADMLYNNCLATAFTSAEKSYKHYSDNQHGMALSHLVVSLLAFLLTKADAPFYRLYRIQDFVSGQILNIEAPQVQEEQQQQ